jgi:hypothetical protein
VQNEESPGVDLVRPPSSGRPLLCIVSVYRPDLLEQAFSVLGAAGNIEVLMDRRVGERRQPERANSGESRLNDRRRRSTEEQLRTNGFVIVHRDDG